MWWRRVSKHKIVYADGIKMEHKTRTDMYTELENIDWLLITLNTPQKIAMSQKAITANLMFLLVTM